jgi:hypothetical protein
MKETPKRRITVTTSLNEKPANQLGCRVGYCGVERNRRFSTCPQKYLQTSYFFSSLVPKKRGKVYNFLLEDGS